MLDYLHYILAFFFVVCILLFYKRRTQRLTSVSVSGGKFEVLDDAVVVM